MENLFSRRRKRALTFASSMRGSRGVYGVVGVFGVGWEVVEGSVEGLRPKAAPRYVRTLVKGRFGRRASVGQRVSRRL